MCQRLRCLGRLQGKGSFPKKKPLFWENGGRGIVRVQIDFDTFSKVKEVAQTGALDFDTFRNVKKLPKSFKSKKIAQIACSGEVIWAMPKRKSVFLEGFPLGTLSKTT